MPDDVEWVFGQQVAALPEGYTPVEVYVMVKCIADDGEPLMVSRATESFSRWELLGGLTVEHASLKRELVNDFVEED